MPGRGPVEGQGNFRDSGLKLTAQRSGLYHGLVETIGLAAEGSRFAANAETDVLVRGIAVGVEQWLQNHILPQLGSEIRAQVEAERGRLAEKMLTDLLAVVRTPVESGADK